MASIGMQTKKAKFTELLASGARVNAAARLAGISLRTAMRYGQAADVQAAVREKHPEPFRVELWVESEPGSGLFHSKADGVYLTREQLAALLRSYEVYALAEQVNELEKSI